MTSMTLSREELLGLLNQAGAKTVQGISDKFLLPPTDQEHFTYTSAAAAAVAMAKVLAQPQKEVHALRLDVNEETLAEAWYYAADSAFVSLTSPAADQYQLTSFADLSTFLLDILNLLPLATDPDTEQFRCVLDRDDFIDVRGSLMRLDEVSAEEILEADGLKTFQAMDFADSFISQQWHGRLTFTLYDGTKTAKQNELWLLQGPDISWVGHLNPEQNKMVVQTATNDVLNDIVSRIWQALDES